MGLRVVFLIENMSFPKDPRVRQEAAALRRQGAEVSVICPKGTRGVDSSSFETIDGIKVYRYSQPWQGTGATSYFLEYLWAIVCTFGLLLRVFLRDGLDVIHAANPPDVLCLTALPFLLFGRKFVFDQHDLCPELVNSRMAKSTLVRAIFLFFERISYKLAALVIVTNQSACEVASTRGADAKKLRVVRNGPDLDVFVDVHAVPELKNGLRYLALYVGTLAPQDGVERILKAASHIVYQRGRKDVTFAIVGDGDSLESLEAMALGLGLDHLVSFPGWLDGPDYLSYLATADVCLAPEPPDEFNHKSSFIKLTEYMCYGKATVSFDLLESRRTLGPAGVFVERDDTNAFGDAILDLLDDPDLRRDLGEIARKRLRTDFQWELSRKALIDAYEAILKKSRLF